MNKSVLNTTSVIFAVLAFVSLFMPMFGVKISSDSVVGESGATLFQLNTAHESTLSVVLMIVGIVLLLACAVLAVCAFLGNKKTIIKAKTILSIVVIVLAVAFFILGIVYIGDLSNALVSYSLLMGTLTLTICSAISGVSGLLSNVVKK